MEAELLGKSIGGRYVIEGFLGEGGMAQVYAARHPRLNRKVAIKLLYRHLSSDPQFRIRFEREAQAIAALRHPHIVQVYDFDFDESLRQFFMVIEYIEGKTLSEIIKEADGLLPLAQSLRIMEELADALNYAHREGTQHRDIKPSNIMIEKGQRTVLMDFGIAKIVRDGAQQITASGAIVGTPSYLSPEQANGQAGDQRSDIYSLGIVFFQLATGRLPFQGDTPIATVLKHITEVAPRPTQFNPSLPIGIESVILRCLAKNPDDRYQSAGDFRAYLRDLAKAAEEVDAARTLSTRIFSDAPTTITPTSDFIDSATTFTAVPSRTNLWIGVGAAAIVILLILGAVLFAMSTSTPVQDDCRLTLEEALFARPEPNNASGGNIRFEGEIEIVAQEGDYLQIRQDETLGWVEMSLLALPLGCELP
jgi:serine/threonine-protein kinase